MRPAEPSVNHPSRNPERFRNALKTGLTRVPYKSALSRYGIEQRRCKWASTKKAMKMKDLA
jgi:hypothetical protein